MARLLAHLDGPMWRLVRELYLNDKVVEAFQEAEKLGGQDSNDLYAEAEARENGEQVTLYPWLRVEAIRSEVKDSLPEVLHIVGTECENLSRRFGWDNSEATLVTLLPQDVEAPWMPGRWGYFVDKVPYDKICMPYHLAFDRRELTATIQHEFMHGISLNLANGHHPRWLSEALSTYAEGRRYTREWLAWQRGDEEWLSADQVNGLVEHDNRDEEVLGAISRAYAQANLVAHFLVKQGGEPKLGELLRAIGDESLLHNLENTVLGRNRTDSALRRIYGLAEHDVFEKALAWIKSTPVLPT